MSEAKNVPLEEMSSFFNQRAGGYDQHMRGVIPSFDSFYSSLSEPIAVTDLPVRVLDLGCGTGTELQWILAKAPNARITCVDVSENMLELLLAKYRLWSDRLTIVRGSYLEIDFEPGGYDYIVSAMTMHHLLADDKLALYKKLHTALKPGGHYIEGDYVETPEREERWLEAYKSIVGLEIPDLQYHYDIPCSIETELRLLVTAGFHDFQMVWQEETNAVYRVRK
ncbi:class I SAM-dependent methyltransferase [Paenibacillus sp. MBLB4367]|uniref:class I SAM-dependent methyltransferase n=1 Tax=Paenibacillus sp. MBLB4367 TaxID=3384767 RepID=UPI0039082124